MRRASIKFATARVNDWNGSSVWPGPPPESSPAVAPPTPCAHQTPSRDGIFEFITPESPTGLKRARRVFRQLRQRVAGTSAEQRIRGAAAECEPGSRPLSSQLNQHQQNQHQANSAPAAALKT